MNLVTKLRIESAVIRYSNWLDLYNVSRRRRRQLRRELRANLYDATAERGIGPAIKGLGPLRNLAAEYAREFSHEPRWSMGASLGIAAAAVTVCAAIFASLNFNNGALDAAPGTRTEGWLFPFPGSNTWVDDTGEGLSFGMNPGWLPLAVGLITFVLVARPWRLFKTRIEDANSPLVSS